LRVSLLKIGGDDHVLLLSLHHIITDGWSMQVLINELQTLYGAFSAGQPSLLPPLSIQYADYAQWQSRWLNEGALDEQLSHWQSTLKGAPPFVSFPSSRPRPAVQTFRGAAQSLEFSAPVSTAITALSQREGATLFMTMLAAFNVLLYRYTGQVDVLIGTPIANRNRAEIEGIIGLFANTLVLRTDLSGNPTFRELLGRVKETALAAYAHQDLPFEKLVEELQPQRNLSYSPLFQVMFSLQNAPNAAPEPPAETALTLQPVGAKNLTAKFDLTLTIQGSEQSLGGVIEYNSDLFDASTISRLASHFQTLVSGIAANADQRISDLPLLNDAELRQMLVEWNDTAAEFETDICLHESFELQASLRRRAPAVICGDGQLTYRELNERANQLAHYLRSLGVGAETGVGICLERSLEMMVAVLGILKAGGAYVPVDPSYPHERIAFILDDSRARLLLTQSEIADRIALNTASVALDKEWERISAQPVENPVCNVFPENLAYIIYTSGSTGLPKGVMVQHRSVINLQAALHTAIYSHLPEGLVVALTAPLVFDASVKQVIQLLAGHTLAVVPDELRLDAHELLKWFASRGVQVTDCTPAQLRLLFEAGLGEINERKRAATEGRPYSHPSHALVML